MKRKKTEHFFRNMVFKWILNNHAVVAFSSHLTLIGF